MSNDVYTMAIIRHGKVIATKRVRTDDSELKNVEEAFAYRGMELARDVLAYERRFDAMYAAMKRAK